MEKLDISNLKAVVFDWDNTLAYSRPALVSSVNKVLEKYGMPCWDIVKTKRDNNLSFQDNFQNIFGDKAEEAYALYQKIYLENVKRQISAPPFSHALLHFFYKRGVPICLMTNKDRKLLDFELPILFDTDYFSKIVCGHEASHNKPHGAHLFETVKNIVPQEDISPQNVWVVGDSPQDSFCACACGALGIRVGHDLWHEDKKPPENCIFFNSLVDFYESLLLSNV